MSKTWYPIIDYEKCTGCLICYKFCRKGVYALKDGKPAVVKPEGCVPGCQGCSKRCPAGAIKYVGDASDKNRDAGGNSGSGCRCSCRKGCC